MQRCFVFSFRPHDWLWTLRGPWSADSSAGVQCSETIHDPCIVI